MGNAYFFKKSFNKAIKNYEKSVSLDPNDALAHLNLGNAYGHQNRYNSAIKSYKKGLALKPDSPDAYWSLGTYCYMANRMDESLAYYLKALEFYQKDYKLLITSSLSIIDQGRIRCY